MFAGLLPDDFPPTRAVVQTPWWRQVEGADWRHPQGAHSDLGGRERHPVVHVSWHDAVGVLRLAGHAAADRSRVGARGTWWLSGLTFPWGDDLEPGGRHAMNVFQGTFPAHDTAADGYVGTAPVDVDEANGFGAYNMTGNVWEWCSGLVLADVLPPQRPPRSARSGVGHPPRDARRVLPLPRVVLPPLPRRGAELEHPGQLGRQLGFRVAADT